MKLQNDGAVVSVSELKEHGCGFIPSKLLHAVQRKRPPITQPQGKRPGIAPEIKPPKPHSRFGLHPHEPAYRLLDHRHTSRYTSLLALVELRPVLTQDDAYLAALVSGRLHILRRGMMPPHVVDAEVIQLPVPSYGVKRGLRADDGGMLWSVPDLEHALTGIAEDRLMIWMKLSLDIFTQVLQ